MYKGQLKHYSKYYLICKKYQISKENVLNVPEKGNYTYATYDKIQAQLLKHR